MAAVYARGNPEQVFARVLPDLYGSVQAANIEFEKKGEPTLTISGLRARYPDAHLVPITQWTYVIGLPIPEDITSLPQKVGGNEIRIETWEYGTVGQILHYGTYDQEISSVERLHQHIVDSGYKIVGVYEEEYLTRPGGKTPMTIIRYRIMKK